MLIPRAAVVLLAALLVAGTTARLGLWQLDRAAQKTGLQAAQQRLRALPPLALADLARTAEAAVQQQHRLAELQGTWLAEHTIYLDNRPMEGHPGFYVVTPLRLADGSAVLVQRGWLPRDFAQRTHIVAPPTPAGATVVRARIAPALPRLYEFSAAASGPIRQNLDIGDFARERALPLRPLALLQVDGAEPSADGLLRQWQQPDANVHMHYGYALQWFALCALTTGLYVWFQLIRPRLATRRAAGR